MPNPGAFRHPRLVLGIPNQGGDSWNLQNEQSFNEVSVHTAGRVSYGGALIMHTASYLLKVSNPVIM